MAIYCIDASPCRGLPGEIHLEPQNALREIRRFSDMNRYIYLEGVDDTVTGSGVTHGNLGSTVLTTGVAVGPFAVAVAPIQEFQYGWFGLSGVFPVNVGDVLHDAVPYASATPGVLDDAVLAGVRLYGAVFRGDGIGTTTLEIVDGGAFIAP